MKVQWAPLAVDRVVEIATYIARDNPVAAEKWVRNAFERIGQLRQFPESGRLLSETPRKDVRELVWGNYHIIHRLDAHRVSILTVRPMKQILPLEDLS